VKIVSRGERITEKYRQPYFVVAVDRKDGYQSDTRLVVHTHWQCLKCGEWFPWTHACDGE
jgi:hypothetical protein